MRIRVDPRADFIEYRYGAFAPVINCWKKRSCVESYLREMHLANSVVNSSTKRGTGTREKERKREREGRVGELCVEYQISRNELPSAKSPIVRDLIADCSELAFSVRARTFDTVPARNVLRDYCTSHSTRGRYVSEIDQQ